MCRRRFNIQLTDAGRALVHDRLGKYLRTVAGCFEGLEREEQEKLDVLLTRLGQRVEATRAATLTGL